jgi:ligand-binding sensor domain-containing protein
MRLICFTFLLLCLPAFGQQAQIIDTGNSGLPENDFWSITANKSGTVWAGTAHSGIIVFKGNNYDASSNDDSPVKGEIITPLFTDSHDRVWASVSKPEPRLFLYDKNAWAEVDEPLLKDALIIDICQDVKGNVYFGCNEALVKYDGKAYTKIALPRITVRSVDVSAEGVIAIGHNSGLMVGGDGKWKEYTDENSELQLATVRAVQFMPGGGLMIGYGGGLGNGGLSILEKDVWQHFNTGNSGLKDQTVRDIEPDCNGGYWMATNNGLSFYKGGTIQTYLFREGKYKNVVMDVTLAGTAVWLATNFGVVKISAD